MRRNLLGCVLVAGLGLFVAPTTASAQMGMAGQNNPLLRPAVSPYVNLARGGNAAANYFGIVRPQVNFANQLQTLQTQQRGYMPQLGIANLDEEDNTMTSYTTTGHPSTFFNYGTYFGQSAMGNRPGTLPAQTIFGKKN